MKVVNLHWSLAQNKDEEIKRQKREMQKRPILWGNVPQLATEQSPASCKSLFQHLNKEKR